MEVMAGDRSYAEAISEKEHPSLITFRHTCEGIQQRPTEQQQSLPIEDYPHGFPRKRE